MRGCVKDDKMKYFFVSISVKGKGVSFMIGLCVNNHCDQQDLTDGMPFILATLSQQLKIDITKDF